MEDWQEWQIRADQIASELGTEVDALHATYLTDDTGSDFNYRGFWPKFRSLKERVRTAPAIRLEAKLDLERRLRTLGARAYKAQEGVYARSAERKAQLLEQIAGLRTTAEGEHAPRALRALRHDFDRMREQFDTGPGLVPPDRQAVWDAWREANQFAWQRLVDLWSENERELREIIAGAQQHVERGNAGGVRQAISRFFDTLRTHEAKQDSVQAMKAEVDALRQEADAIEERGAAQRVASQRSTPTHIPSVSAADTWRAELARNRELSAKLSDDAAELERQMRESESILEQAMLRGNLVDKKRRLNELERSSRTLEQKIEQTEETPLLTIGS